MERSNQPNDSRISGLPAELIDTINPGTKLDVDKATLGAEVVATEFIGSMRLLPFFSMSCM